MDKPDRLFDVRTVRRNMSARLVTPEEYAARLDALEDCADNVIKADTRFVRRAHHDVGEYSDDD